MASASCTSSAQVGGTTVVAFASGSSAKHARPSAQEAATKSFPRFIVILYIVVSSTRLEQRDMGSEARSRDADRDRLGPAYRPRRCGRAERCGHYADETSWICAGG